MYPVQLGEAGQHGQGIRRRLRPAEDRIECDFAYSVARSRQFFLHFAGYVAVVNLCQHLVDVDVVAVVVASIDVAFHFVG